METDPTLKNTRQYDKKKDEFQRQKVQVVRDYWIEKTGRINMEDALKVQNQAISCFLILESGKGTE